MDGRHLGSRILALGSVLVLTAFAASATEPPIVFDRGANLFQVHPLINLRAPSALYTVVPDEAGVEPPVEETPTTPPTVVRNIYPELVPGTRDGSTNIMGSWFPDRSKIAYVSNRTSDTRGQIWVVDVETGAHTQITANEANNLSPAVSPDASQIVYLSTNNIEDFPEEPEPGEDPVVDPELWRHPENLEIYVMNVDGTNPRRLTDNDIEEEAPVYSFFGDTLYFIARVAEGPTLYSIPLDGDPGDEMPILGATNLPVLGTSLSLLGDPLGDILTYNSSTSVYTLLDLFTRMATTGATGLVRPSPSDDGAEVAYVPGGNLYVADADGANARSLILTGDVTSAQWRAPIGAATPVALRLDRPNGGEVWPRGATLDIEWKYSGFQAGPVRIELSRGGLTPLVVVASTENDGVYEWTIPTDMPTASDYLITVSLLSNAAVVDTSAAPFAIVTPQNCPKPTQVAGVVASDGAYGDRVRITWNAAARADEYLVYRNRVNSWSNATLLDTTEETFFEDTTAAGMQDSTGCRGPEQVKTEYFYWVRAVNDCGLATISQADKGFRGYEPQTTSAAGDTVLLASAVAALALWRAKRRPRK
jgi:dipeptidyl aminopeptidase/acylaminoacyl peptidase